MMCLIAVTSYAGIGSVYPDYDYDDFLVREFFLDQLAPLDLKAIENKNQTILSQGYFLNNYLFTNIIHYQHNLFTVENDFKYYDNLYQGSFILSSQENHRFRYHYYNYPHKESLNLSSVSLKNSISILSGNEWGDLSWDNYFNYLAHHSPSNDIALSGFANKASLSLANKNSLISTSLYLPQFHDEQYFGVTGNYFYERGILTSAGFIDSYLFGMGVSYMEIEDPSIFPSFLFRYTHHNRFIIQLKIEESIEVYPLQKHFQGHNLLWGSFLPLNQYHTKPFPQRTIKAGTELLTGPFKHDFYINYSYSDYRFGYDWESSDKQEYYGLFRKEKETKALYVNYNGELDYTSLGVKANLFDRIDFQPRLTLAIGKEFKLNPFNHINLQLDYNIQEKVNREKIDYGIITLSYSLSNTNGKYFEAGINYSTMESDNMKWRNNSLLWLRISFG